MLGSSRCSLTCTLIAGQVSSPGTLCAGGQTARGRREPAGRTVPRSSMPVNNVSLLRVFAIVTERRGGGGGGWGGTLESPPLACPQTRRTSHAVCFMRFSLLYHKVSTPQLKILCETPIVVHVMQSLTLTLPMANKAIKVSTPQQARNQEEASSGTPNKGKSDRVACMLALAKICIYHFMTDHRHDYTQSETITSHIMHDTGMHANGSTMELELFLHHTARLISSSHQTYTSLPLLSSIPCLC